MWLFTKLGFFSAVQTRDIKTFKPVEDSITVRGRVRADMERLREFLGCVGPFPEILTSKTADYPYRVIIHRRHWIQFTEEQAGDIDYTNFKSMIDDQPGQGRERHDLYMDVWRTMLNAEYKLARAATRPGGVYHGAWTNLDAIAREEAKNAKPLSPLLPSEVKRSRKPRVRKGKAEVKRNAKTKLPGWSESGV